MARILVVDDDEMIRTLLRKLLGLHGHRVDAAADGAEAVDRVARGAYDLVIMDRFMPVMSGVDAVSVLRSTPRFAAVRILMVTNDSVTRDVDEAFDKGVDGYVVKPFEAARLLAKIDAVLLGGRPGRNVA
jgi:CheY-like chemotaxis protein